MTAAGYIAGKSWHKRAKIPVQAWPHSMIKAFRSDPASKPPRKPLFSDLDKLNVRWFCRRYLKEKTPGWGW